MTKKPLTHQKVCLLKPSGKVILEEAVTRLKVRETMVCPVTNKKLKDESDILMLVAGFTGFSAHNEVETKSFKLMRGAYQEAHDRTGSLGAKGMAYR